MHAGGDFLTAFRHLKMDLFHDPEDIEYSPDESRWYAYPRSESNKSQLVLDCFLDGWYNNAMTTAPTEPPVAMQEAPAVGMADIPAGAVGQVLRHNGNDPTWVTTEDLAGLLTIPPRLRGRTAALTTVDDAAFGRQEFTEEQVRIMNLERERDEQRARDNEWVVDLIEGLQDGSLQESLRNRHFRDAVQGGLNRIVNQDRINAQGIASRLNELGLNTTVSIDPFDGTLNVQVTIPQPAEHVNIELRVTPPEN